MNKAHVAYAVAITSALVFGCSSETIEADEEALVSPILNVAEAAAGGGFVGEMSVSTKKSTFACTELFDRSGTRSLDCERDSEHLEILHRGDKAIAIYKKEGRSSDKKVFYECLSKSSAALPTSMTCTVKTHTSRAHGPGLASAFDSSVDGLGIPNAHKLSWYVFRGMAPVSTVDYDELEAKNIDRVLIFKVPTGDGSDVADEQAELTSRNIESIHIPFAWKDLPTFRESCEQTVEALAYIRDQSADKHHVFFHCSIGEDRTGYLAGVHRLFTSTTARKNPEKVLDEEMCDHGFSSGDPVKPAFFVAKKVDEGLLPLYRKMAFLIQSGKLDTLDKKACVEPTLPAETPVRGCTTSALFQL